jgi:hypothetical protein
VSNWSNAAVAVVVLHNTVLLPLLLPLLLLRSCVTRHHTERKSDRKNSHKSALTPLITAYRAQQHPTTITVCVCVLFSGLIHRGALTTTQHSVPHERTNNNCSAAVLLHYVRHNPDGYCCWPYCFWRFKPFLKRYYRPLFLLLFPSSSLLYKQ